MSGLPGVISKVFAAGCIGGLANAFVIWLLGKTGVTQWLGVQIVPQWTPEYIYPKVVWGGVWGFLFLLPLLKESVLKRGIVFSLAPTAAVLFYVLPYHLHKGMMGQELGDMVPLFAVAVNAVWGIVTAWWVELD